MHAHTQRFDIWTFRTCEICGSVAQNVSGLPETDATEQWDSSDVATAPRTSVPLSEARNFWQGHRFLNFLLACMVFAFVISWLFHFNVPSWSPCSFWATNYYLCRCLPRMCISSDRTTVLCCCNTITDEAHWSVYRLLQSIPIRLAYLRPNHI